MREIKFRGKRIDNHKWVHGYYFEGFTGIPYILVLHDHILGMTEFYEVDPDTVGQYTGLKDKNGKEIWEGDVCRVIANTRVPQDPFAVIWNNEYAQWFWKDLKGEDEFWKSIAERSEVIGNIHDNPELLGEQL